MCVFCREMSRKGPHPISSWSRQMNLLGGVPGAFRSYSSGVGGGVKSPAFSQKLAFAQGALRFFVRKGWLVPSCVQAGRWL